MKQEIMRRAKQWLGTPFHHQAWQKGIGCDCYGLIYGLHCEIAAYHAIAPVPPPIFYYPAHWQALAPYQEQLITHLKTFTIPTTTASAGDILLFGTKNSGIVHCGIKIAEQSFINACNETAIHAVVTTDLCEKWQSRLQAVYAYQWNL